MNYGFRRDVLGISGVCWRVAVWDNFQRFQDEMLLGFVARPIRFGGAGKTCRVGGGRRVPHVDTVTIEPKYQHISMSYLYVGTLVPIKF